MYLMSCIGYLPKADAALYADRLTLKRGAELLNINYREMVRIMTEWLKAQGVILGYDVVSDAEWHSIPASVVGAIHQRDRVWIIAYPHSKRMEGPLIQKPIFVNSEESRRWQLARAVNACLPADDYARMRPNYDDVPEQMAQLKAYGNAIVPQVAEQIMRAIAKLDHIPNVRK